jgi:6-phosphogluconate dehydrogenase
VAWWLHHQGKKFRNLCCQAWHLTFEMQSVFLGDITAAYEKNSKLESLLFDDFFKKGEMLSISPSRHNLFNQNSCS